MANLPYGYGPPSPYGAPTIPTIPISKPGGNMGFSLGGLGGVISSGINFFSARDTNKKQKALAREQMGFQERLSNTAYQRAVKDMRAAGINPMLAYAQGGASTPTGAQAQLRAPSVGDTAIKGLDVGSKTTQRKLQNQNIEANNDLIKAQTSSAEGLAKQNQVVGNYYLKYPELAPLLGNSPIGSAVSSAKGMQEIWKRAMRKW